MKEYIGAVIPQKMLFILACDLGEIVAQPNDSIIPRFPARNVTHIFPLYTWRMYFPTFSLAAAARRPGQRPCFNDGDRKRESS